MARAALHAVFFVGKAKGGRNLRLDAVELLTINGAAGAGRRTLE
jgi:hypothetical protein